MATKKSTKTAAASKAGKAAPAKKTQPVKAKAATKTTGKSVSKATVKKVTAKKPVVTKSAAVKKAAKPIALKAVAKKPAAKKPAAKKPVAKKSAVKTKSATTTVKVAKKTPGPRTAETVKAVAAKMAATPPRKKPVRSTASSRTAVAKLPVIKPAAKPKKHRFAKKDLTQFREELLGMRDRISDQAGAMRTAALQRHDEVNPEEDGTDAFIRLQTLNQVGSQQQMVSSIDEALRSIEEGTYGVCDMCGELITKQRLKVLPFAHNCINCQSEVEKYRRTARRR